MPRHDPVFTLELGLPHLKKSSYESSLPSTELLERGSVLRSVLLEAAYPAQSRGWEFQNKGLQVELLPWLPPALPPVHPPALLPVLCYETFGQCLEKSVYLPRPETTWGAGLSLCSFGVHVWKHKKSSSPLYSYYTFWCLLKRSPYSQPLWGTTHRLEAQGLHSGPRL